MGKEYSWAEVRERAAGELGGYPDAQLEQEILEVFRERPAFVSGALDDVIGAFRAGRIHSPWLLLRKQVTASPLEAVVVDESERESAVAKAERWLQLAGLHFDREEEVADELFGDRGSLRAWASDEALRARLLASWRDLRPLGEQAELEALERAATRRAIREKLAAKAAGEDVVAEDEWAAEGSAA